MKTLRTLITLCLAGSAALFAADNKNSSRVQVEFREPEKFSDVKDSYLGSDKGREAILAEIHDFVVDRAGRMLPEGQSLSITFTDIDLAGDYEPGRHPNNDDIRLVKAIYPPRINLSYRVTDASGAVIKEGTKELRDLAFQNRITLNQNDRLRYEKDLLTDWFRSEFRKK